MSRDPGTMHVHGGFGGPGGEGHGQGTGGPGGIGQGPTLHMERVENLNIGGQKEAEIWNQMEDTKRRTIIEWLSPLNFFLRQQDISKTRQQGTGGWLLDDPKFKSWISNPGQVLWCSGILEHLADQSKNKNIGVACIYFNHKETQIQNLDNLLAGLWRQFIWDKDLGSAVQLYEQHIRKQTRPSHEDMQKLLSSALIWFTQIYIILDGVDEYPADWWTQLAKALTNLGPASLLVMSRPHIPPTKLFLNLVTLEIRANDKDILSYVDTQVQESGRLSELIAEKPELHGEISSKICSSAEGMFLLSKLHIEALSKTATIKAVRQALQKLPKDLDATYENVMTRINAQGEEDKKIAQSALTWVANARRPLTSSELCVALAIEPKTTELDNDNMTTIGIILSGYLDRIQTEIFPNAHIEITQSLLTYLQFAQFLDKKAISREKRPQLLQYCQYCLVHAQRCEGQLRDEILGFLREARKWQQQSWELGWWDPPWSFDDWPHYPSSLWVAASANLVETATHLIELAQKCPDSQELTVAAYYGHKKICQLLLNKGADVNAQGGGYGNALQAAASRGQDKIVQVLLDKGADVNAQGGFYENALRAAASGGHDKIVQVLLDKGADVNAQGGRYGNALQAAASGGHDKIVQVLLDKGADVNAQGGEYGNALQEAASRGHDKIVQVLLDKGADVNAQREGYGNALQAAASGGHVKIVQVLLDKGADVNAQGGRYGDALQAAASGGHVKIVQVLLDKGADVNAQGGRYGEALWAAASGGHDKIVQVLLDKGADVNAQGRFYENALQAAASGGHDKIVQVLLDKGADVNAQGGEYGNALQAAASRGHEKIVQVLLDKGADVNAQRGKYQNAVQAAAYQGHDKVVEVLFKKAADMNVQGRYYANALQTAAFQGHGKVVEVLLNNSGADMNAQQEDVGNVLSISAFEGHHKLLKSSSTKGGKYGNALQAAAYSGKANIVQLLLTKGADINAQGGKYGNALQAASYGAHPNCHSVVWMLLKKGTAVNAQGGHFGNALQAAAYNGKANIVQALLHKGADINAQGGKCGNALQAAANQGHHNIVQMLLDRGKIVTVYI
ncbi:ankyrin repeat-containing domain protein [Mycena olivaceomarginata]|nr:ankyrin repeat-containing domain protein [Mycena olivaceomarginata]